MFFDLLRLAFPASLLHEVREVSSVFALCLHDPMESRIVVFQGERLEVPYRIYNDVTPGKEVVGAINAQVLACILTRHHDGRKRQRNAALLYGSPYSWVIPFVFLLSGEYVIEILTDIEEAIPRLDLDAYRRVIEENPDLWMTTERRVTSYWNEYHRREFWQRDDYVGFRLLRQLSGE